jgi:hypothetical protein
LIAAALYCALALSLVYSNQSIAGGLSTMTNDNDRSVLTEDTTPREFHFSTGIVAKIKPISPYEASFMRAALTQKHPRPTAPTEEIEDLGEVPNESHPDHIAAVDQWVHENNLRLLLMMFRYAVDFDQPESELAKRVAIYETATVDPILAFLMQDQGLDRSELRPDVDEAVFKFGDSPKVRFIYLIAANGNEAEIKMLGDAVTETLQSTEAAIKAISATF